MGLPYPIPVPFSVPSRCQLIAGFIPPLYLICIQCRTNSLFCISERPLGRGDTSIFNLTRCISTGILSYTASLYNTSTPHRNLYVGITESIVTQQSPHGVYCFLFFVVLCPGFAGVAIKKPRTGFRPAYEAKTGTFNHQTIYRQPDVSRSSLISFFVTHSICEII